jgi:hypothetical protein
VFDAARPRTLAPPGALADLVTSFVQDMVRKAWSTSTALESPCCPGLYVGIDVVAAIGYPEYHSFTSRVISELMAGGAPTERLVDPLFLLYDVLVLAFSVGVWMSRAATRVRLAAALLAAYAVLGSLGPTVAEMNLRGSGGPKSADILHIALTMALVILMLATMVLVASTQRRAFRVYSYATMVIMVVFGVLTSFAMRGVDTGEPTPWVGLLERIDIGAFLLWEALLAITLLRDQAGTGVTAMRGHGTEHTCSELPVPTMTHQPCWSRASDRTGDAHRRRSRRVDAPPQQQLRHAGCEAG